MSRRRMIAALIAGFLLMLPPVVRPAEQRPLLKGGVEHEETRPESGQSEGICAPYFADVSPLDGQPQLVPKTGQGSKDYCYVSFPNWRLLGEDGNYCCYFAPRDFVIKRPPVPGRRPPVLPGRVQEDGSGNIPCRGTYTECFGHPTAPPPYPGKARRDQPPPGRRPPPPDPCQVQLRRTGIDALDTMAAMGQQTDRFLTAFGQTLSQAIVSGSALATDPSGFTRRQAANIQGLLALLSQDNESFEASVWQASLKLLDQARKDPAGTLGSAAANALINRGVTAAGGVAKNAVCKAGTRLKRALKRVKELEAIEANQPRLPSGSRVDCPSVNPSDLQNGCFPRAVAYDRRQELSIRVTANDYRRSGPDVPTSLDEMSRMLRTVYGGRRFGTLTEAENLAQAEGKWIPTKIEDLKKNLAGSGNGSRALVFAQPKFGATVSHIINVAYDEGINVFDAEKGPGGVAYLHSLFDEYEAGASMELWYFRTAGPDMLP